MTFHTIFDATNQGNAIWRIGAPVLIGVCFGALLMLAPTFVQRLAPFGTHGSFSRISGGVTFVVFFLWALLRYASVLHDSKCRFAFHDETIGSLPFNTLAETVVQGSATHVKLGWPIFALHVRLPDRFIDHNILA
jgi:hypothetical protein